MGFHINETLQTSGTDSSNATFTPASMGAEAANAIWLERIVLSVKTSDDVLVKDSDGNEIHRFYAGDKWSGGIDYGTKPWKLPKGKGIQVQKIGSSTTNVAYAINYKRVEVPS